MTVAEQIRAVPLIDRIMMETTLDTIRSWAKAGFRPPKVAFNLSTGRLRDRGIVSVARELQDIGVQFI